MSKANSAETMSPIAALRFYLLDKRLRIQAQDPEGTEQPPAKHLAHWAYEIAKVLRHHAIAQLRSRLYKPPTIDVPIGPAFIPDMDACLGSSRFRRKLQFLPGHYVRWYPYCWAEQAVGKKPGAKTYVPYSLSVPRSSYACSVNPDNGGIPGDV